MFDLLSNQGGRDIRRTGFLKCRFDLVFMTRVIIRC